MSRALFAVWPLAGHLHPMIEIARELRNQGWDVGFYCGEETRAVLELDGFALFPFRRIDSMLLDRMLCSVARNVTWKHPLRLMQFFGSWLLETVPAQVADVTDVVQSWKPSVILCDESMWGPTLILAEKLKIHVVPVSALAGSILPGPDAPLAGFGLGPPKTQFSRIVHWAVEFSSKILSTHLRSGIDSMRSDHGLPPLGMPIRSAVARSPLYLVRGDAGFDYNRRDLPPSVRYIGPLEYRGSDGSDTPNWMRDLRSDTPVVFASEGTMQSRAPALLRAVAEGLRDLHVQLVIATGRNRDPGTLGIRTSPNLYLTQWVPQHLLFERTDVVVTVGGCGTVLGALARGVPLVVVPTESDQPDNAQRVVASGAGIRVCPRRCTPSVLRRAVMSILADPEFRANARRVAATFAQYHGARYAANLIEELVAPVKGEVCR